jgi:hypothetical protein
LQAYPAIYSWTTYPLTALIETNWDLLKKIRVKLKDGNEEVLQSLVAVTEVTGCAERALNFMHTGNPAVIKTSVMNPLWIGRAIIHDGLPSFNTMLVKPMSNDMVKVQFGQWPYDDARNLPKSTSESALRYRYNELTVGVRMSLSFNTHAFKGYPKASLFLITLSL